MRPAQMTTVRARSGSPSEGSGTPLIPPRAYPSPGGSLSGSCSFPGARGPEQALRAECESARTLDGGYGLSDVVWPLAMFEESYPRIGSLSTRELPCGAGAWRCDGHSGCEVVRGDDPWGGSWSVGGGE